MLSVITREMSPFVNFYVAKTKMLLSYEYCDICDVSAHCQRNRLNIILIEI